MFQRPGAEDQGPQDHLISKESCLFSHVQFRHERKRIGTSRSPRDYSGYFQRSTPIHLHGPSEAHRWQRRTTSRSRQSVFTSIAKVQV